MKKRVKIKPKGMAASMPSHRSAAKPNVLEGTARYFPHGAVNAHKIGERGRITGLKKQTLQPPQNMYGTVKILIFIKAPSPKPNAPKTQ